MQHRYSLPTKRDFDPFDGCLDALSAYHEFGGKTVEQARQVFLSNPEYHHEHFAWMGAKAFAYYFPIVDEYLRDIDAVEEDNDRQAWILAECMLAQLDEPNDLRRHPVCSRIAKLADHVHANVGAYTADDLERRRITEVWAKVKYRIASPKVDG